MELEVENCKSRRNSILNRSYIDDADDKGGVVQEREGRDWHQHNLKVKTEFVFGGSPGV